MKQRLITSVIALSLLTIAPAWGQTSVIRREKQQTQSTKTPKKEFSVGAYKYVTLDGASVSISAKEWGKVPDKELVIPSSIEYQGKKYTVKKIDCFQYCKIESVKIPSSVTEIGESAFAHCASLSAFTVPSQIRTIGVCAFEGCKNLQEIKVDPSNQFFTSVDGVLYDKQKTKLLASPGGKTNCNILSGVKTIGFAAFRDSKLESVIVPRSVNTIESSAFWGCKQMKSIDIPTSVTTISDYVFAFSGIEKIVIPSSINTIPKHAFSSCKNLKEISIPQSINRIEDEALRDCCIKILNIPASVQYISEDTGTLNIDSLQAINVETGNTKYSSVDGVLYNKSKSVLLRVPKLKQGEFIIPPSVKDIAKGAFYYCKDISSVIVPQGVTTIGEWAFCNTGIAEMNVPSTIKSISRYSFWGCSKLNKLSLPSSILGSLKKGTFNYGCYGLKVITVRYPNGQTKELNADKWKE